MDENRETKDSAGMAHTQCASRKKNLVEEHKQHRAMTGGLKKDQLGLFAGTQYPRITSESKMVAALHSCSGRGMRNKGKYTCNMNDLPRGLCTTRISRDSQYGGTHPLSPEYQFNAKRREALGAWLVDFEGNDIDVHPDHLDPGEYFNGDTFKISSRLEGKGGFFFCIDPFVTNIFDLPLPRPVYANVIPGPELLALFKEEMIDVEDQPSQYRMTDRFTHFMCGKDAEHLDMERQASEAIATFDTIGLTPEEREQLRYYGERDDQKSYVIEPRQKLKECQMECRRVNAKLIQPWLSKRRAIREEAYQEAILAAKTDGIEQPKLDYHRDERMAAVRQIDEETQARYCAVVRDLVRLHLSRIEAAFESRSECKTIPAGYCAMAEYLKKATHRLGTASIAWALNIGLVSLDTSAFSQTFLAVGQLFEEDCFIEGRDRRIMASAPASHPVPACV